MQEINYPPVTTWFIAHNNVDIFHTGRVEDCCVMITSQPNVETFTDESAFLARCAELGVEP